MAQKETRLVVSKVENELLLEQIKYYNFHGSTFSENGAPDIIACVNGKFIGIECKLENTQPYINQLRQAIYICRSKGRYIVAKEDFNINNVLNNNLPKFYLKNEIGEGEFTDTKNAPKITYEISLQAKDK